MKSLKAIKNSYSILTICLILVGAVLLIWPHMALGAICKMCGITDRHYRVYSRYFTVCHAISDEWRDHKADRNQSDLRWCIKFICCTKYSQNDKTGGG